MQFISPRRFRILAWSVFAFAAVSGLTLSALFTSTGGASPSGSKKLTILYSNQAFGQIRSCNCTKFRYGGYGREATLLQNLRKEDPNVVLVEGGDAVGREDIEQDKLKSEVAMKAMKDIGYAAFVPGESELRFDREHIQNWAALSKTPFIMANAKYKETGEPVCDQSYIAVKMPNGLRVTVIGVAGPELFPDMLQPNLKVEVSDPEAAVKDILRKVRSQSEVVIVIAHMTTEKARPLARIAGIDALICTHSFEKLEMPEKDRNIVQTPHEKIGDCVFVISNSRSGWGVGRLDLEVAGKKINVVQSRTFFLDREYDEHPTIVKLYDEYNTKVAEMTAKQQNQFRQQFEERLKERGIDPSTRKRESPFTGGDACKTCHEDAYSQWAGTRHATAMATLEKMGQQADPECVGCHTTGALQRGGFTTLKETPNLVNVQCEACHGAGLSHKEKPTAGYGKVSEELCRSCHTEAYNPDFDYEAMLAPVRHKKD